jgi:tetratricopeptide (TPR) repeat protein
VADRNPFERLRLEIDPDKLDEAVRLLRERLLAARDKVEEGVTLAQHTKVRVSYKGRRLGPDLPLPVFLAGEGVALAALGPLITLVGNLAGKAVLEIEFVHEADALVAEGRAAWEQGEVEQAERRYRDALDKRRDDPAALYHLGVLLRVTGRADEALDAFRRAAMGPPGHPDVARASEQVERLQGKRTL